MRGRYNQISIQKCSDSPSPKHTCQRDVLEWRQYQTFAFQNSSQIHSLSVMLMTLQSHDHHMTLSCRKDTQVGVIIANCTTVNLETQISHMMKGTHLKMMENLLPVRLPRRNCSFTYLPDYIIRKSNIPLYRYTVIIVMEVYPTN